MDLNKIPVMDALIKKMNWLNRRQRVIADNVANADTPGYVARDLKPEDFSALLRQAPQGGGGGGKPRMATTNAKHMTAGGSAPRGARSEAAKSHEASPTGNTVILEEQMINMAATQMEYGKMITLYRRHVGLLKASLGRGQR